MRLCVSIGSGRAEAMSYLLFKLQCLEQWLALTMKNWYYFYGGYSLKV